MDPSVLRGKDGIQLSFDLPHRINETCVYPQKPSNGSTVIICAHEKGLKVIWYGGRQPKATPPTQHNGNSISLVDDENENEDNTIPQYEDEEQELDPARPFHEVLKFRDIDLGIEATKIAVPPSSLQHSLDLQNIFSRRAVVLTACADFSLRLIVFDLEPGSTRVEPIETLTIDGVNSHQDLISAVAITLTADIVEPEIRQALPKARSRDRNDASAKALDGSNQKWSLLLASTSVTGTGLLLIHQVIIDQQLGLIDSLVDLAPIQRGFLKCLVAKCTLEFNPAMFPSNRHSQLLIASSDSGMLRIYGQVQGSAKQRKGSATTVDSASLNTVVNKKFTPQHRVLIDLRTSYQPKSDHSSGSDQIRLLDAKWILHGRAIIVLLDNGEWGVWDLEAAGPTSSSSTGNLMRGQTNIYGLQGGSSAKFALRGKLQSGTVSAAARVESQKSTTSAGLIPMTPHTRKSRTQDFFKGQDGPVSSDKEPTLRSQIGSLAVRFQSVQINGSKTQDESILFNYQAANFCIPSIQSYWRSEVAVRGAIQDAASARIATMPSLVIAHDDQKRVHFLPLPSSHQVGIQHNTTKPAYDFITSTSSRVILFVSPLTENTSLPQTSLPISQGKELSKTQDQILLTSGELDVDGMDRILDRMAHSGTIASSEPSIAHREFKPKSVAFQSRSDEDEDVDMDTPTTTKNTRNTLFVTKATNGSEGGRRLFT